MSEPGKFDRMREKTAYEGRRTPVSSKRFGMSVWSMIGAGLMLVLVVLLVANAWRGTQTVAPLRALMAPAADGLAGQQQAR